MAQKKASAQSARQAWSLRNNFKSLTQPASGELAVIDGLRALSILWVILFHILFSLGLVLSDEKLQAFINQYPALLNFTWQGDKGVDIFFVVSGFLIGSMLFKPGSNALDNIPRFYSSRAIRIMPVYLLAVALWCSRNVDKYAEHIVSNIFFLEKLLPDAISIVPGGWSLGIEMQFYLLAPLLAILLFKYKNQAITLLLALAVITVILRFIILAPELNGKPIPLWALYFHHDIADDFNKSLYVLLPFRAAPILLGLAVAWIYTQKPSLIPKTTATAWLVFLIGTAIVVGSSSLPLHNPENFFYQDLTANAQVTWLAIHRTVFSTGIALILISLLSYANLPVKRFFSLPIWRPISQLVLPMYLFHFAFITVAAKFMFSDINDVQNISNIEVAQLFLLSVALTTLFAVFVHLLIERPAMNLRPKRKT